MAKQQEEKKSEDLLQSSEALQEKVMGVEHWIENNPKIVLGVVGVLVLVVGGFFGYRYYTDQQNDEAQKQMFQAIRYFEQHIDSGSDSLEIALKGDGNNMGFIEIAEDYGNTQAGKLANFYAGAIFLKQGKYNVARLYLEDFSSSDLLVQARAYSLTGDCYMEEGDFAKAANLYNKAANHQPNKFFTPGYLMKEALAYEKLNQNEKAIQVYQKLVDTYWDSSEAANAKKYKARLEPNS